MIRNFPPCSWPLVVAGCLVVATGCSSHPELNKLETVPVRGRVTLDGKPVTFGQGRVAFLRADGEDFGVDNWSVRGRIRDDGTYELHTHLGLNHGYSGLLAMKQGAPPGRYYVTVQVTERRGPNGPAGEPKWLVPKRYRERTTSGLVIEVVSDPEPGAYDLHLGS